MESKEKSLDQYNEGDVFRGELITRLYAAYNEYLIFEGNNSGEITIGTDNPEIRKRCGEIIPYIDVINAYLIKKKEKLKFVDQIGLAYCEACADNIDASRKVCERIIDRIVTYKNNLGRFYYILSCFSILFINVIVSYFLKKYRFEPILIPYFYAMTFASIGGFISVSKNVNKINVQSDNFGLFQFFYGVLRIFISMLSGFVIIILMKSEWIFPSLIKDNNVFVIYSLSIIAGFSESLIPNLLNKIESEKL